MRRPILLMPSTTAAAETRANSMPIWTIYRPTTREFTGSWVARMTDVYVKPSRRLRRGTFHVADTLEAIRAKLPRGLHRLTRKPQDDPVIEEVWI